MFTGVVALNSSAKHLILVSDVTDTNGAVMRSLLVSVAGGVLSATIVRSLTQPRRSDVSETVNYVDTSRARVKLTQQPREAAEDV